MPAQIDSANSADNAPVLTPVQARSGRRVGLIWMLLISTALAAIVLMGLWAANSRHLKAAQDTNSAARAASVSQSNTELQPSPAPAVQGELSKSNP